MRRVSLFVLVLLFSITPLAAQTDWVRLPGMRFAGQVTRDANGVAYIRALTDWDAAYLNGWVHAQDRLFQMDENRRTASGTLAELLGTAALPTDIQLRTLGLRRAAGLSQLELSPRANELLNAYAAGVNAWVGSNPLPPEYAAVEVTKFEPWTALDSVAVAKLLAFGLSFELDIDYTVAFLTYRGAGQQLGFDGTKLFSEDLFRSQPFSSASTVPDATHGTARPGEPSAEKRAPGIDRILAEANIDPATVDLAKKYVEELRQIPFFQRILDDESRGASNEWAIAGKLSASGSPMIANDPHLSLRMPSIFYPLSIRGSRINAAGVGFPGAPFVVQGHTDNIAWGSTVNPLDVTDTYQEQVVPDAAAPAGLSSMYKGNKEALFPILQTFRANNPTNGTMDDLTVIPPSATVPQATLIVSRRNAPIISLDMATGAALSVQWIGHGATRELDTFLIWNEGKNLADFQRGLQYFDVGSQNWIYTDTAGNIAYFTSGEMPLRADLQNKEVKGLPPWFLRNGQSGENDWIRLTTPRGPTQASLYQILPPEEMPMIINPEGGWIVNANNDPAGTTLDNDPINQLRPGGNGIYYLAPGYNGYRAGRITQLVREKLAANEKFTIADMQRIQADVALLDAMYFVPWITQAFDNAAASGNPTLVGLASHPAVVAAVTRLRAWDFTTPTGIPEGYDAADPNGALSPPSDEEIASSVAATIYSTWRGQILKNTIDAVLGVGNLPRPGSELVVSALKNIFDNFETRHGAGASGVPFFNVPGVPNTPETAAARRDIIILKSLADSIALLASDEFAPAFGKSQNPNDYRWGKLHRIVFRHPMGGPFNTPPAGGQFQAPLAGLTGIPVDGGFQVVDASTHNPRAATLDGFMFTNGPARRAVSVASSSGVDTVMGFPGGASGVVSSPLYVNLLRQYLTNDSFQIDVQTGPSLPWGGR